MEDFILREIDKIGKLIEAILVKLGVLRRSGAAVSLRSETKTELAEKFGMDIDDLVGRNDFVEILVNKYGFSNDNLEKFAELLFDFLAVSPVEVAESPAVDASPQDHTSTDKYRPAIAAIYDYLMKNSAGLSISSYYILEELGRHEKKSRAK